MIPLAPVVVIAIGNPSRGDDALGPQLLGQLEAWLASTGRLEEVDLVEDFQLQIEHAMDLQDRRLALFIDAGTGTPAPYAFGEIAPNADFGHTTHAISPAAVLHVFRETLGGEPPPSFVLCVRGDAFELGTGLSETATGHLEQALIKARYLLEHPDPAIWRAASTGIASIH